MNNVPEGWKKSRANVINKYHRDIGVHNMWINEHSNAVLVQYMTITTVNKNKYVELYQNPETVKSRFKQFKELLTSDDIETEMKIVGDGTGASVAKVRSKEQAKEEAYRYMRNNPKAKGKPEFQFGSRRKRGHPVERDIRDGKFD